MDKSNKKDEMRAAGKKRLEEFRMKRQHKTGPVKAAESKNYVDDQISSSDLSPPLAGDVSLLDAEADPVNEDLKLPAIEGRNGVEEQVAPESSQHFNESTIKDGIDTELANNLSQQGAVLDESQSGSCNTRQCVNEDSNTNDSLVNQMATEKTMLAEQLATAKRLLEQHNTEYCEREKQLLAATKLSDEVKAQYANELDKLTTQLEICHTDNDQLSKQLSDSREQSQRYEEEIAQQEKEVVDLEKQVQALLEEKHLREVKLATVEKRFEEEEKSNHLLSSSLQQAKEELLEARNRESILLVQLDSARTELSSVEKEKGQVSLGFEAAASMVRNIEEQKLQLESALEKEMQEKASLVAATDHYVSQLIEHRESSGQLMKENEHLADEVKILKSEIHSLQGDRQVSDSVFQQQILQLTQDFDKISQESDLLRSKLSTSSNENMVLQKELESVKKDLEEVVDMKRLLSDELVSAKEYVQAALEENKQISAEVDALRNSSEVQLNENIQLKADSQFLTSELCRARQISAQFEKELLMCQQSLAEVVKVRGQLEDGLKKLSLQSEEWQREKTELLSEVDSLNANLVAASSEKSNVDDHLQAEKDEVLTENQKLHEESLELKTKLEISVRDVKNVEAEKDCLLAETELLRLTMKEATEQRDSLRVKVVQMQQVNDELKEETCALQAQLEAARNGWQNVKHSKAVQDVEVEQLKQELHLSSETLQQYVEEIKVLEQEKSLLKMHISKAESTSLELEQAVRQVLPFESPEVGRSSKSADSGVHLASCVRKLIHEFEARANHSGHDVQVQTHVSEHESSLWDGSVELLEPLSRPKERENLQNYEGDVVTNFEQISVSDLQALRSQLRETCEEISRLEDVALSKSQEIVNVTEQLSKLKEENQAAAQKYEGQVSQLLSSKIALESELASSEKKCEEQGDMIQSYLETFKKVYGSLTALKENLCIELGEARCTGNLEELGTDIWSELESLVDTCHDMVKSLLERNSGLRQQMGHLALEKDDLRKLAESVQDQVATLNLEKARAVKLNSEMLTELSDVRGCIQQLETSEAKNQSLLREYETEQVIFRQRVLCLLEMFNLSCHNVLAGMSDVSLQGQKDGTASLLNQLEERSKAFVDFSTLQLQEKMKLIAELEGKVGVLEDSLSGARAEADEIRCDLKLLAEKVEMPSMRSQDCGWDDSVALSTDVAGNLALNIGTLIRVFQGDLQNKMAEIRQMQVETELELRALNEKLLNQVDAVSENEREVRQELELSKHELQRVRDEHRCALETIQVLRDEIVVQERKEVELAINLEGALSRITVLNEQQQVQEEGNRKLQCDLASLQKMTAARHEGAMRAELEAHSEVQTAVEAFVLQVINNLVAAVIYNSDTVTEIVQDLVRDISFSGITSCKIPSEDIEQLRQAVLKSALEYKETVMRRAEQNYDEQQKLEAFQAESQRCLESAAHHDHEMKALLEQTRALNNHVVELQSEISSLKSERFQGEQRLAASKDKLALAVSRGKALGHQRDALKQSLAEKTQELNLVVATYSEQLKEKGVGLEATKQDLTDVKNRADMAEQELAGVKESLFMVEQQLLGCTTTFAELETVMKEVYFPDDVNTKELSARVTWIVRSCGGIQQELTAAMKELENLKETATLLEIQLKDARDKEAILISQLEAERHNLNQQWSSEVEKCMRAQALLFEEASQNASAKEVLQAELDLTTEKLAAEVAFRHKLQTDFEAMVAKAQSMVPNSIKAELSILSFPTSFNAVTSSLLALYNDTASEVEGLKEQIRGLMMQFEQTKEVDDELTYYKRQAKNLQQVVADKDLEIKGLTTKMEEAAGTMAHQEEEISGMSQLLHKLKHNLDEALNEKKSLQTELTDMERRLSTTREKLGMAVRKGKAIKLEHDTLKHSLGEKLAQTEARVSSDAREMQSKDSLLQELQVKLSAVLDENRVLHEEKEAAISQLVNETAGTRSVMEETTVLRARKLQQEHELESLKGTLSAHATELNRAQLTASQFSSQVTDLQVTNSDLSEELAAVKLEMLRLRQENGEVGSLKACITSAVESMKSSIETLERLQRNHGASTGTALESRTSVSNCVNDAQGEVQQGYFFTEDFMQRICQRLVERVQYFATWSQQMIIDKEKLVAVYQEEAKEGTANLRLLKSQLSSLKQQVLSKDREAVELKEEREHLQVAIQDIQTLSKKALEEKESTIRQMKHRLAQLEGTVKDLVGKQDVDEAKIKALEARKVEHEHEAQLLHSKFQSTKQRADEDANSLKQSQAELATLRELLSARNEDLEAHMQALFEAESQVDSLSHRVKELEGALRQKHASLQSLESSRSKAIAKLNTNYQKLNEVLHQSEGLLALSENLQLDLEKRDAEILRLSDQLADFQSQENSMQTNHQERNVNLEKLQTKLMGMVLKACNGSIPPSTADRTGEVSSDHTMLSDLEVLESLLESLLLEVEALKSTASKKDNQLQDLRIELQVLSAEKVSLQGALQSQQMQLQSVLAEAGSTSVSRNENPPVEIEGMGQRSKRALGVQVSNAAPPHVRGTRKLPMSDVVLDVDLDQPLHDVEDKGHDYKSLAMAKFMPRVMRPAAERLDGFCVAGGRLLMRQPSVRFGLMIYWIFIHLWITSALIL